MTPRELIDRVINEIDKGDYLSGAEVAQLHDKQGILINGKRAVVVDVAVKGRRVELTYVKGAKSFGKEQYIDVGLNDKKTPIQYYFKKGYIGPVGLGEPIPYVGKESLNTEQLTQGIKNALARNNGKITCPECGLVIPVYPGRYPKKCPECGADLDGG